jgi:Tol biopolymer transport system component
VKPADGVSAETVLLSEPSPKRALDWSPDGRSILFVNSGHLYALPVTPDGKPDGKSRALTDTNKSSWEDQGKFSPDSRWIAYQSNQSGRNEIYLQPFPGPGKKQQVTTEGGTDVRWPRKGKELFYVAPGNKLMAVPITLSADGQKADVGTPTPIAPNLRMQTYYSVSADGQHILMNASTGEPNNPPVTVILHWKPPPK